MPVACRSITANSSSLWNLSLRWCGLPTASWSMAELGRVAPSLRLCRGCNQFVFPGRGDCRFCGGDLAALERAHEAQWAEVEKAADALRVAISNHVAPSWPTLGRCRGRDIGAVGG